ncbi:hypothetical protein HOP60_09000 [Halomonas daqingensis]|uniref:Proteasome assembly chaperone 3 n=1 Tax=Billgrantia desiderata TaxID=52021 RepID=A0ABS9B4Q5_9GAMM|nr:hypothetical protein [Halomonas desiderata]MCE8042298.1 hypothetical protein [Halomonas desiderata]MCE8046873.1 hypothetical protein [Halomonas desiderata]
MLANLHAITTVQDTLITQSARRNVQKLASAVGLALNIQPGRGLVMVLGAGSERNNQEALESWVAQTLIDHDLLPTRETIPLLIEALEAILTQWQEDATW